MKKTAEAVSLGHPDKIADYISSYILDCLIQQDSSVKYAVEVMIKNHTVVLGGEITGSVDLSDLADYVRLSLNDIGYTPQYFQKWQQNTINPDAINIIDLISAQSAQINQGVAQNGWGDQGVFVGYACQGKHFLPAELVLARELNQALYQLARQSDNLGLDIKTQITLDEDNTIDTAIVAIPMLKDESLDNFICQTLQQQPRHLIINGTGSYQTHASVADCGITGRKLACDFYSTTCPIGGGSPWTKDGTKADLTLNLYARELACQNLGNYDECFAYLSSCIGQSHLTHAAIKCKQGDHTYTQNLDITTTPRELIHHFKLHKPVYTQLCRQGPTMYTPIDSPTEP